ncbi:cupin domain-containing protein [Variovorax rhizosphaerae]|uniref:Cupin domain-containing protein n=1 Tax=Variovorax rhizosphaerae TaxID=1836200 RepID=A0ABU8WLP9_9BURK
MIVSTARPKREESIIRIPALGLTVRVRFPFEPEKAQCTVIETTNAAGFGPPLHRRTESETFQIVTGRYLFEVDGRRFIARRGDLVRVPAGAARAFVNVTGTGARQQVIIEPGIDAAQFFRELAALLDNSGVDRAVLRRFGQRWGVALLGPSLKLTRSEFDDGGAA